MSPFLTFSLRGAMAAWGDIAVGEARRADLHPSRSALLGLLGAAFGVRRADLDARRELASGLGFSVRVDLPGHRIRDYHTTQVPRSRRGARWRSRYEELDAPSYDLETILSEREYACDVSYLVAAWPRDRDRAPLLKRACRALTRPAFVLYLGRKSCPLTAPTLPRLVDAPSIARAFAARDDLASPDDAASLIYSEQPPSHIPLGLRVLQRATRRDEPTIGRAWLFTNRDELMLSVPAADDHQ